MALLRVWNPAMVDETVKEMLPIPELQKLLYCKYVIPMENDDIIGKECQKTHFNRRVVPHIRFIQSFSVRNPGPKRFYTQMDRLNAKRTRTHRYFDVSGNRLLRKRVEHFEWAGHFQRWVRWRRRTYIWAIGADGERIPVIPMPLD